MRWRSWRQRRLSAGDLLLFGLLSTVVMACAGDAANQQGEGASAGSSVGANSNGNAANQPGTSAGSGATMGGSTGAGAKDGVSGDGAQGAAGSGAAAGATTATGGNPPHETGTPLPDGPGVILVPPAGGAGGTGGADICTELEVNPEPVVPTVAIVVDNSSSMFEPREELWDLLYSTLMDPATGVVKALEGDIRFGFASYKGHANAATSEVDEACATIENVPYALDNHEAIDTLYARLGAEWMPGMMWETPTGHAVNRVSADLQAFTVEPPGPKFILLVTDGDPNTCLVANPQCGQDQAIKAVQDAHAAGIGTFVIGIGDIIANNSGCVQSQQRCGPDHLQDIANAGQGLPVADPPPEYVYQACIAGPTGGMGVLSASYASATGEAPGMAPFYAAGNSEELRAAIEELLNAVRPCTFDMDAIVTGNPAFGLVRVGGVAVAYDDPDGWVLETNRYQVTLQGAACAAFQTGEQALDIEFPCDESGRPIAVPR